MEWIKALGKDTKGSRPRCALLTDGIREEVAERLTQLIDHSEVSVSAGNDWMPAGKYRVAEAELGNPRKPNSLVALDTHRQLQNWWLETPARTPNWDIASTCVVKGRPGILLVEAKAHTAELDISKKGKYFNGGKASLNSKRNHERIGEAIDAANTGLRVATEEEWNLARDDHYQVSNRFAWAWKLVDLGIPVVLVYLGFLQATEMVTNKSLALDSFESWEGVVKEHCNSIVPESCWGLCLDIGGTHLLPLIRAYCQPFCSQ